MYTAYTLYTAYNIMWLAYYSSSHGSTGSILDRTCINQLASCDSSLSSRNIVLKASVTSRDIKVLYKYPRIELSYFNLIIS